MRTENQFEMMIEWKKKTGKKQSSSSSNLGWYLRDMVGCKSSCFLSQSHVNRLCFSLEKLEVVWYYFSITLIILIQFDVFCKVIQPFRILLLFLHEFSLWYLVTLSLGIIKSDTDENDWTWIGFGSEMQENLNLFNCSLIKSIFKMWV